MGGLHLIDATPLRDAGVAQSIKSLRIVGLHPVVPTEDQFREAVAIQWGRGGDLTGAELAEAETQVRAHFANLFLIEVEVDPPDAAIDWSAVTQSIDDEPVSNWQAPYDERPSGEESGRWNFFFHFLDLNRPLRSEIGDLTLPARTPIPDHLRSVVYEVP